MNVEEMARGQVFPSVDRIRDVSLDVAVATVESALRDGDARGAARPGVDVRAFVEAKSLPGLRAGGDGPGVLRQLTFARASVYAPRAQICQNFS